jgi:hypothetical protein
MACCRVSSSWRDRSFEPAFALGASAGQALEPTFATARIARSFGGQASNLGTFEPSPP